MKRFHRLGILASGLIGLTVLTNGCAYMQARGNDAKDVFDIGITVTKTPHVGVYAGFNSIIGVGYVNMDGHMLGMAQRRAGVLPMRFSAGGMVLEGYEQYGYCDDFDANDKATPKRRGNALGMLYDAKPSGGMEMFQCPKIVHLGWVGVNVTCKLSELADFVLGWTTIDIADDDAAAEALAAAPEKK